MDQCWKLEENGWEERVKKGNGFHQLRNAHSTKNKETKKQLKKDKNDWVDREVTEEAQKATEQGHLKAVYDATRKLSAKKGKTMDMIKSKEVVLLTK